MSNWTVSKVYLYLLALITFSVLLFNFVSLTASIPDYITPAPGWVTDFTSARNEMFVRKHAIWPDIENPDHVQKLAEFDEEKVKEFLEESQLETIRQSRAIHLRSIIRHGFSFILLLPVHIYFFKLARKS